MVTFADFEKQLHDALVHLYDPLYQPPDEFFALLRASTVAQSVVSKNPPPERAKSFQQILLAAIESLRPDADVPARARSRRIYELLASRYVQELTQEETAERLGITPRHLRREQQQAVLVLAQQLWAEVAPAQPNANLVAASPIDPWLESAAARDSITPDGVPSESGDEREMEIGAAWRTQVQQEVAALQQNDPNTVAEIAPILAHVQMLERRLAESRGVTIGVEPIQEAGHASLAAQMHPSLLRQMVIIAVQKLLACMNGGEIRCRARRRGAVIEIIIEGEPIAGETVDSEFLRETLATLGGALQIRRTASGQGFYISVPYQVPVNVLVVDDNHDLVHFYRRYTERTRYSIHHVGQGQEVFAQVIAAPPDVIVLDVMLPDMDGWEVLTRLRESPDTSQIPVIICSVIRQKELALALGAALYLPKPVRRQEFLRALDDAIMCLA
jgi:CheY-like chemotaxis protein/AraC-like DNA-binding protein